MFNYSSLPEDQLTFYEIVDVSELPNGEQIFFSIGDETLVMFNIAGAYYAIADQCSHDHGPVGEGELMGTEIKCPRHGARFDLKTGKALSMPAREDIPAFPVRVTNGKVQVGIPRKK